MSETLQRMGHDPVTGRDLFLLRVPTPALLEPFRPPTQHHVCLLIWDADRENPEAISRVADVLMTSGCVYLCAWGTACERVHDVFDESAAGAAQAEDDDSVVMTTWHAEEPLEEAIWFFLRCTSPDGRYAASSGSSVCIVIGDRGEWVATIQEALLQPIQFAKSIEDREQNEATQQADAADRPSAGR